MTKHTHILTASSNLLGIALVIIIALTVTGRAQWTIADSVTWLAAGSFTMSCLFSYLAIRREPEKSRFENWADPTFLAGLILLAAAVALFALTHG